MHDDSRLGSLEQSDSAQRLLSTDLMCKFLQRIKFKDNFDRPQNQHTISRAHATDSSRFHISIKALFVTS
jgi:hypothetical protein